MKRLTIGRTRIKEPVSAITHLVGAGFAVASLVLLVTAAAQRASAWHVVSLAVFGGAMVLVYTASTLYHWLPLKVSQEKLMRRIDQSMIYLMIAGTCTPVALVALKGAWGWTMFGCMWAMAIFGVVHHWKPRRKPRLKRHTHAGMYLAMGWATMLFSYPVIKAFPVDALAWLFAGGMAYTVGGLVYALKAPNPLPKIVGFHEVFHLFVMLGPPATFGSCWRMFCRCRSHKHIRHWLFPPAS